MPDPPDPAADPLAASLAKLAPVPAALATPAFLFAAGRASEARRVAFWRRLCQGQAALGCAGVALFAASITPPPDRETLSADTPVTPVAAEVAPPESAGDGPTLDERIQALRLRNDILAFGLSALPEADPPYRATSNPLEDDR